MSLKNYSLIKLCLNFARSLPTTGSDVTMNSLLLLTLCMLGMAAAQDSLWTALGKTWPVLLIYEIQI